MLTEEQKEVRRQGIGGSDAAAIAGVSRYKTPVDVYLQKHGLAEDNDKESEAAYWGNVLERHVADRYAARETKMVTVEPTLLKSEKYPWMIANIDRRIIGENAILECKTCNQYKYDEWGEEYTDEVPDEYLLQVAHYAIVLDVSYADLAVLIGGQAFRVYRYERNKQLEQNLIELEHDFWHNNFLKQIPPALSNYEDAGKLWKLSDDSSKTIAPELNDHLKSYQFYKQRIKEYQEQQALDKAKLCEYLQESSTLLDEYGQKIATWKNQSTCRFQMDEFKKSHPDLYKQFCKTSESRVFRLKELK